VEVDMLPAARRQRCSAALLLRCSAALLLPHAHDFV